MADYHGSRLCGVPDNFGRDSICQFPPGTLITWTLGNFTLPQFAQSDIEAAIHESWRRWMLVCGVRVDKAAVGASANITYNSGRIDGAGNTLAWMELPCGGARQLKSLTDVNEAWIISDNPPRDRIDFTRVICHENGHGIGIGHIGSGNLMAPTYSVAVAGPQNGDIVEARARYGGTLAPVPPVPAPDPPTNPPTNPPADPRFDVEHCAAGIKDGKAVVYVGGVKL